MRVVLDTSAASALMRREPRAEARLRALHPGDVLLTTPVAAEITFGLKRLPEGSRRRALLQAEYQRLRDTLRWRDWSEEGAIFYGERKARLERLGTPVGDMDVIIASIALAQRAAVATMNAQDIRRVPELEVLDWSQP